MKKLMFVSAIALTLGACSNEVIDRPVNPESTEKTIEFRTLTDKASTYAAITNEDNILSFTVTGIKNSDGGYLFNGFGITRGEGNSGNWDYTPKRFWPTSDKVHFYAYSPSSSRNVSEGITDYLLAPNDSITYTVPLISEIDAQEDFLVARILNQDEASGTVKLNFHHALSRIKFFAKTTNPYVTYVIDSVKLLNLYQTAQLSLEDPAITETGSLVYPTAPATLQPWDNHTNVVDYIADMGKSPVYMLNDYASILGETNAILVMPQTTKPLPATPIGDEFAIQVFYKAFVDDIYYAGAADSSAVKLFAVSDPNVPANPITFEMGRQYNFFLTFGEEVGGAISFEVNVSDWNDEVPNIVPSHLSDYAPFLSPTIIAAADKPGPDGIVTYAELMAVKNLSITGATDADLVGLGYLFNLEKLEFPPTATLGDVVITNVNLKEIAFLYSSTPTVSKLDLSKMPAKTINLTSSATTVTIDELVRRADQTVTIASQYSIIKTTIVP